MQAVQNILAQGLLALNFFFTQLAFAGAFLRHIHAQMGFSLLCCQLCLAFTLGMACAVDRTLRAVAVGAAYTCLVLGGGLVLWGQGGTAGVA